MAKELDLQTKIIHSARKQGGYGRKMSNRFSIGIPDLLLGIFPFAPSLVEVKDLEIVVDKFDRKLDVTPKQALEMERLSKAYEDNVTPYTPNRATACVLVGVVHRGEHRLVALSRGAQRLDHTYEASPGTWVRRMPGGFYDVMKLLDGIGIARVSMML